MGIASPGVQSHSLKADAGFDVSYGFGRNGMNQITSRMVSNSTYVHPTLDNRATAYQVNSLNQYDRVETTGTGANSASLGYDANGNLTGEPNRTYAYDVGREADVSTRRGAASKPAGQGLG